MSSWKRRKIKKKSTRDNWMRLENSVFKKMQKMTIRFDQLLMRNMKKKNVENDEKVWTITGGKKNENVKDYERFEQLPVKRRKKKENVEDDESVLIVIDENNYKN